MWNSLPLLKMLTKPRSNRIDALQKRVKWIENHSNGNAIAEVNIKQLKARTCRSIRRRVLDKAITY
jgi:hypothetical protein